MICCLFLNGFGIFFVVYLYRFVNDINYQIEQEFDLFVVNYGVLGC